MCGGAGFFAHKQVSREKHETSVSWKQAKRLVEAKGGRLLTLPQVHDYLQKDEEPTITPIVGSDGVRVFPHKVPYSSILGPKLLPFKVRGEFRCVLYQQGHRGGLAFSEALQVPEAHAIQAVLSFLPTGQVQGRTHLVKGFWTHVPYGLSYQIGGDFAAHLNTNTKGKNDENYYMPVGLTSFASYAGIVFHEVAGSTHTKFQGFTLGFGPTSNVLRFTVAQHTSFYNYALSHQVVIYYACALTLPSIFSR